MVATRRPVTLAPINDRLYVGLATPPGYVLRARLARLRLYAVSLLYTSNDTAGTGRRLLLVPVKDRKGRGPGTGDSPPYTALAELYH